MYWLWSRDFQGRQLVQSAGRPIVGVCRVLALMLHIG